MTVCRRLKKEVSTLEARAEVAYLLAISNPANNPSLAYTRRRKATAKLYRVRNCRELPAKSIRKEPGSSSTVVATTCQCLVRKKDRRAPKEQLVVI